MRRFFKRVFWLGLLSGAAYAGWRWWQRNQEPGGVQWEPQPAPLPPRPVASAPQPASSTPPSPAAATAGAWVEPRDGACPPGYPVKAKLASGIFHVPGGRNYERTVPDRCYASPEAAEADGLRAAKA